MTMAATVASVRRILQDKPDEDYITAAVATTSATTMTVNEVTKWVRGQVWEFDDGSTGAEQILVKSVDATTSTVTIKRGHNGSTAATHLINCVLLNSPRFRFDEIAQAANTTLDADLFKEDIWQVTTHQITSQTTSTFYNSPTANCERWLDVYQKTSTMLEPARELLWYSPFPTVVDTTLFAAGKYFQIVNNYGTAGTDLYYVTCAHKLGITTLSNAEQRIVELFCCAYLMEWIVGPRTAGPTNQGDRSVPPGATLQPAAYYRQLAEELIEKDRQYLTDQYPATRRFVRS